MSINYNHFFISTTEKGVVIVSFISNLAGQLSISGKVIVVIIFLIVGSHKVEKIKH